MVTEGILVESQIRKREVKGQLQLHNQHIDHVTIQSELRYLIGAKCARLKWHVFGGKPSSIATVWFLMLKNPLKLTRSGLELELEPNWEFRPIANTSHQLG